MPEQGEAEKAVADPRAEAVGVEPHHHGAEPEQACRDLDAATADRCEAPELGHFRSRDFGTRR
jgi:hypothetical protein